MDDYEVSDAPRMTVNLKRLTRVLAKQWTEVSPEELYCQKEVEQRKVEMERMKVGQKDSQVDLDTFFEYNLRTATLPESEDLLQVSDARVPAKPGRMRRKSSKSIAKPGFPQVLLAPDLMSMPAVELAHFDASTPPS
eukprot:symbB.v1.2.017429.t1/scaffold1359.1/size123592/14